MQSVVGVAMVPEAILEKLEPMGWLNTSLKSTVTRSTNCTLKVMSRCLSAPDATSLHHCLQNHCLHFTNLS